MKTPSELALFRFKKRFFHRLRPAEAHLLHLSYNQHTKLVEAIPDAEALELASMLTDGEILGQPYMGEKSLSLIRAMAIHPEPKPWRIH